MISAHAVRMFGPDTPRRYFSSYGPDVMRMWAAFKAEAGEHVASAEVPRVVRTARETFEKLRAWSLRCGMPA